jgi:hypothetical protein
MWLQKIIVSNLLNVLVETANETGIQKHHRITVGACGSVVGWNAMLQAGR